MFRNIPDFNMNIKTPIGSGEIKVKRITVDNYGGLRTFELEYDVEVVDDSLIGVPESLFEEQINDAIMEQL